MSQCLPSGISGFDEWFRMPSPGYTVFWVMPETSADPGSFIANWIRSSIPRAKSFLAHCTRSNIDGFLKGLSSENPGCASGLLSLGPNMHFLDSYSVRLELFGEPLKDYTALDIRYVTDISNLRGAGTVSHVLRELREECALRNFMGIEDNLTDLAMDLGEAQHIRLFSEMVTKTVSRRGTMIGIADWYSHGEIYKANIIHIADASILWGITSGSSKTKYLLPIKRDGVSPASLYEPKPYDTGPAGLRILEVKPHVQKELEHPGNCYL